MSAIDILTVRQVICRASLRYGRRTRDVVTPHDRAQHEFDGVELRQTSVFLLRHNNVSCIKTTATDVHHSTQS